MCVCVCLCVFVCVYYRKSARSDVSIAQWNFHISEIYSPRPIYANELHLSLNNGTP